MRPVLPWFPEPGSYVKYYDAQAKDYRFLRLMWQRGPLLYPRRLPSLSAGSKGDTITLSELNPSQTKKHRYLAYIGVKPGFYYYLWHPFDVKNLKWDESIEDISEDLTACITYESSPYEYPTKYIAIERDRYPAIQAKNVSGETRTPEICVIAAMYVVKDHQEIPSDEIGKLVTGQLRSYPWDFGGEL